MLSKGAIWETISYEVPNSPADWHLSHPISPSLIFFLPTTIKQNWALPNPTRFPLGAVRPRKHLMKQHVDARLCFYVMIQLLCAVLYTIYTSLGASLWCCNDFSTLYFIFHFSDFFLFPDGEGAHSFLWLSTRFLEMQVPAEDALSLTG